MLVATPTMEKVAQDRGGTASEARRDDGGDGLGDCGGGDTEEL